MTGRGRAEPLDTFVKVPTFVLELACTGGISPRALLLYTVLRNHRNNTTKTAWPSNARLAEMMGGMHRQNVPRLMNELVGSGAVIKQSRAGTSNVYGFPETAAVITHDDTTVITSDDTEVEGVITHDDSDSEGVITGDDGVNHPGLHGVITSYDRGVITSDVQTRTTELDRIEPRSNERLADASGPTLRAVAAGPGSSMDTLELKRPAPGRDWRLNIGWINDHLPALEPLGQGEEFEVRDRLQARETPQDILASFIQKREQAQAADAWPTAEYYPA